MPYKIEHALKVSTRPVNPHAREILRKKLRQDRQTHTYTQTDYPKPLSSTF